MYNLSPIRFVGQSFTTSSLGTNDPQVGDIARFGNEDALFVYNVGSSTLGLNKGCVVSGVSGYSVTVSSTSSSDLLIGVAKYVAIPTGSYGYVVTKGWVQVDMAATSGSVAAGGLLELSADGFFAPRSNSTGAVNFSGKAMAAIVSSASGTAYISVI